LKFFPTREYQNKSWFTKISCLDNNSKREKRLIFINIEIKHFFFYRHYKQLSLSLIMITIIRDILAYLFFDFAAFECFLSYGNVCTLIQCVLCITDLRYRHINITVRSLHKYNVLFTLKCACMQHNSTIYDIKIIIHNPIVRCITLLPRFETSFGLTQTLTSSYSVWLEIHYNVIAIYNICAA